MTIQQFVQKKSVFIWLLVITAALLLIPLIAMQFTAEVNWKAGDFVVMAIMLMMTGSLFIWLARRWPEKNPLYFGVILLLLFFTIWAELAVGIFTDLGS